MSSAAETSLLIEEHVAGNETLIFNVGGVTFETYRSTLSKMQSGPLADNVFLEKCHRPDKNDYFFDRDPEAFKVLLNYLRTGQVSIPAQIDGPLIRNELVFWGLNPGFEVTFSGESSWLCANAGHNEGFQAARNMPSRIGTGNKMWNILSNPETSILAKIYAAVSYILMFLSVFLLVAETTSWLQEYYTGEQNIDTSSTDIPLERKEELKSKEKTVFLWVLIVSIVCCIFFTVEYILRIIFSPNKKLFILSFLGVIDFLAILPNLIYFLIEMLIVSNLSLRILRILRVFRILRLMRIFKHFKGIFGTDLFVHMLKSCFGKLLCLYFFTLILVLFWGTLVYGMEFDTSYNMFENIPAACWWAAITMTTVGYGDIIPITWQGKIVASLCAVSGLLVIGLLISIIVISMVESSRKIQHSDRKK